MWRYTHNTAGQVTAVVDPAAAVFEMKYDEEGLEKLSKAPLGRTTVTTYGDDFDRRSRGNPTKIEVTADERGANGSDSTLVTIVEYEHRTNQPVKITDPRGTVTKIERDALGLPEKITRAKDEPEVSITQYDEYNDFGQVTKVTNPNKHVTTYAYFETGEERGYLEKQTVDPEGLKIETRYERDARGNVEAVIDPRGVTHLRQWNEVDWLVEDTRATTAVSEVAPDLNYKTVYLYDANGNLEELRRPFGDTGELFTSDKYEYGVLDELLVSERQVLPGQPEEAWVVEEREYDANLNLTFLTEPDQQRTHYVYEKRNLLDSVTYGFETPEAVTESYEYDPERQQIELTDGRLHTWKTKYDGFARVKEQRDPLENYTSVSYDNNGNPLGQQSFDGGDGRLLGQMTAGFDKLDRRIKTTERLWRYQDDELGLPPTGVRDLVSETEYDPASNVKKTIDALKRRALYEYDNAERLLEVTDPMDNRTERVLGPVGNVTEVHTFEKQPEAVGGEVEVVEKMAYDAVNRLAVYTDAENNSTTQLYDARDNLRFTYDAENYVTEQQYDGLDRRVATIRPEGIAVVYGYDASSRLRSYADALNNTTRYEYDALNRRFQTTWEDTTQETLVYDASHNVTERTDPNGRLVTQDFDPARRLTGRLVTPVEGVIGPLAETHDYDGLYRMTFASSGDVTTRLAWDSLSRLIADETAGRTVAYDHDDKGNVTGIEYPSGRRVEQEYDKLDRPKKIGSREGGDPGAPFQQSVTYGYRGPYLQAIKSLGNGLTSQRQFDPARRLLSDTYVNPAGETVFQESYSWSPRNLKVGQSRGDLNGQGLVLAHDKARRLTHAAELPDGSALPGNNSTPSPAELADNPEVTSFRYDAAENLLAATETEDEVPEDRALPLDGSGRNRPARGR